jgi:hypothetical protein
MSVCIFHRSSKELLPPWYLRRTWRRAFAPEALPAVTDECRWRRRREWWWGRRPGTFTPASGPLGHYAVHDMTPPQVGTMLPPDPCQVVVGYVFRCFAAVFASVKDILCVGIGIGRMVRRVELLPVWVERRRAVSATGRTRIRGAIVSAIVVSVAVLSVGWHCGRDIVWGGAGRSDMVWSNGREATLR